MKAIHLLAIIFLAVISCKNSSQNETLLSEENELEKQAQKQKDKEWSNQVFAKAAKEHRARRAKYTDEEWMEMQNTSDNFGSGYDIIDIYHVSKSWVRNDKLRPYQFRPSRYGPSEQLFYINWSQQIIYTDNSFPDPPEAKFQKEYEFSNFREIILPGNKKASGCNAKPLSPLKMEMFKMEPACEIMFINDFQQEDCVTCIDIYLFDETERFCISAIEKDVNGRY